MKKQSALGFEAHLEAGGKITVPPEVVAALGRNAGAPLYVQLTSASVEEELRSRGVTDDEVFHIARLQMEQREQVIAFLLAEGALAGGKT